MLITEMVIIITPINIMAQVAERRQAAEPMRIYTSDMCAVCNGRCMPACLVLVACYYVATEKNKVCAAGCIEIMSGEQGTPCS